MGNRAVITTNDKKFGVYLHWHGGEASVRALLAYCSIKGYRTPEEDDTYALARLAQTAANLNPEGLGVGVGPLESLDTDNFDNGTYVIEGWAIEYRDFFRPYMHEPVEPDEVLQAIVGINLAQPKAVQLNDDDLLQGWKDYLSEHPIY